MKMTMFFKGWIDENNKQPRVCQRHPFNVFFDFCMGNWTMLTVCDLTCKGPHYPKDIPTVFSEEVYLRILKNML